jgi:5-formyltetrahydrofolate cyclo-ligase
MESKSQMRRIVIARRDDLPAQQIRRLSAAASSRLFGLPQLRSADTVMFFVSFGSEIDTVPMIEHALAQGMRVAAPAADPATRTLTPRQVKDVAADLAPGAHGIREPRAHCPAVPLEEIDVIIVPAAAWGEDGYRVGYGGGYYDRFLAQAPRAARVGLGLEVQVVPSVPHKPPDLPVDVLVTEARVRPFRARQDARARSSKDATGSDPA